MVDSDENYNDVEVDCMFDGKRNIPPVNNRMRDEC